jgi:hypothetical protein
MLGGDTMTDKKADIDHVEKAYDAVPIDDDVTPEQDWTPEEEKAVVYVSLSEFSS